MTLLAFGFIYLSCLAVLLAVVFKDTRSKGGREAEGRAPAHPMRRHDDVEQARPSPRATQGAGGLVFSTHH